MPHPEFMNNRDSTGYNPMVNNYDYVIDVLNLDRNKVLGVVKSHLFTEDYINQRAGLIEGLKAGGIKKADGTKLKKSELNRLIKICIDDDKSYVDYWLKYNGVIK
jgi:hypothetical protein